MQFGGMIVVEGMWVLYLLKDSGLVDFLNVVCGYIDIDVGLIDLILVQGMCNVLYLEFVGDICKVMNFFIFYVVKIFDVLMVCYVIDLGLIDMVGMMWVYMVDLYLVCKVIEGCEDDICFCVGVNYCFDWIYQGGMVFCLYNVVIGCEQIML